MLVGVVSALRAGLYRLGLRVLALVGDCPLPSSRLTYVGCCCGWCDPCRWGTRFAPFGGGSGGVVMVVMVVVGLSCFLWCPYI